MKSLKLIIALLILGLVPFVSFAQEEDMDAKFQAVCIKTWMERADKATDRVAYKNFGEKYCGCAAGKNLDTPENLKKAAQLCMSQIILRDTIDTLEEDQGLSNLTQDQIQAACQAKWKLMYPDMSDDGMQRTTDYCQCAAGKMMNVLKDKDNLTDADWYKRIDGIASECADKVVPDKETTSIKSNE